MHYLTFKTDAWLWFGPCLYKLVCRYATVNNFTLRVEYFKQSSSIKKLDIKMGKPSSCLAPKSCCSDRKWNWYDWLDVVKVEILSSGSQLHLHNLTFVLFWPLSEREHHMNAKKVENALPTRANLLSVFRKAIQCSLLFEFSSASSCV